MELGKKYARKFRVCSGNVQFKTTLVHVKEKKWIGKPKSSAGAG